MRRAIRQLFDEVSNLRSEVQRVEEASSLRSELALKRPRLELDHLCQSDADLLHYLRRQAVVDEPVNQCGQQSYHVWKDTSELEISQRNPESFKSNENLDAEGKGTDGSTIGAKTPGMTREAFDDPTRSVSPTPDTRKSQAVSVTSPVKTGRRRRQNRRNREPHKGTGSTVEGTGSTCAGNSEGPASTGVAAASSLDEGQGGFPLMPDLVYAVLDAKCSQDARDEDLWREKQDICTSFLQKVPTAKNVELPEAVTIYDVYMNFLDPALDDMYDAMMEETQPLESVHSALTSPSGRNLCEGLLEEMMRYCEEQCIRYELRSWDSDSGDSR